MTFICSICKKSDCRNYYAYIRYKKKWFKIGIYYSGCKEFNQFDNVQMYKENKPKNYYSTFENEFDFSKLL